MSGKYDEMSLFEQLRAGIEDSIVWSRDQISLKTTTLPAPAPQARAAHVSSLRRRLKMSQAVFAATLNVSPRTVQSWEQGTRAPSDAALRLLQVVARNPEVVRWLFTRAPDGASARITRRKPTASVIRKPARRSGRKRPA